MQALMMAQLGSSNLMGRICEESSSLAGTSVNPINQMELTIPLLLSENTAISKRLRNDLLGILRVKGSVADHWA